VGEFLELFHPAGEGAGGLQVGVHEPPGNGDRVAVGSEAAALVDADDALYGAAGALDVAVAFGVDELKRRGRVEQIERAIIKNAKGVALRSPDGATLEREGFIRRQPGVARSIEKLIEPERLPVLR
jgi:hypothetical protein